LRAEESIPFAHTFARSTVTVFLALAYQMNGQARSALRKLDELLPEARARSETSIAGVLQGVLYIHLLEGNFHQAAQVLYQLQQVATRARLTFSMTIADWALGRINYEWNHLEVAKQHFNSVFELRYGAFSMMVNDSMVALALLYQAQGRPEKRRETLAALRGFDQEIGILERLLELDSVEARLAVDQDDLQAAIRWSKTMPLDMPTGYTFVILELPIVTKARVLIAQGTAASLREAVGLLQVLLARADSTHNTYRQIGILAHLALAYQAQGLSDDALRALERSVKLAEPGGFIRTFVDLGPEIAALLYQLAERGVSPDYLGQVLATFSSPDDADSGNSILSIRGRTQVPDPLIVEPLTRREREILKLLAQDLSNQEIAQALVISPLTVKRHASNIYAKLGVSGRMKAVAKAKTLGLLPSD
jgi:LuxR family maltose regulon positive regulatory protein